MTPKQDNRKKRFTPRHEHKQEFEQKILDIARVTRVVAGGKRMRFRATVIIGDGKGRVGMAVKKGADVSGAITKAVNAAKKNIIKVPMVNETIPHEIKSKFKAAIIMLKPASKGRGVIAGSATRMIMELAGVKNVVAKMLGTNNKLNTAKATMLALTQLKQPRPEMIKNEEKENAKTAEVNDNNND
jgi:small subunit ribosomal protein S5